MPILNSKIPLFISLNYLDASQRIQAIIQKYQDILSEKTVVSGTQFLETFFSKSHSIFKIARDYVELMEMAHKSPDGNVELDELLLHFPEYEVTKIFLPLFYHVMAQRRSNFREKLCRSQKNLPENIEKLAQLFKISAYRDEGPLCQRDNLLLLCNDRAHFYAGNYLSFLRRDRAPIQLEDDFLFFDRDKRCHSIG